MGKGRVLQAKGEGLYEIEVLHDRARLEQQIARLTDQVAESEQREAELQDALSEAQTAVANQANVVDQLIDQLAAGASVQREVDRAQIELSRLAGERDLAKTRLAGEQSAQITLRGQLAELQAVPADPIMDAWCADYTEDLAGEIGTVEIRGEGSQRVIIRPGFDSAAYNPNQDGVLTHRAGCSPAQAFANAAILPGWQRFRFPYRVGELIELNQDVCSVVLDAETSSAAGLPIQAEETVEGLPIEYMDCNGQAFEVGDRVLVDMRGPKVIGFESEPRMCGIGLWSILVALDEFGNTNPFVTQSRRWRTGSDENSQSQQSSVNWPDSLQAIHQGRLFQARDPLSQNYPQTAGFLVDGEWFDQQSIQTPGDGVLNRVASNGTGIFTVVTGRSFFNSSTSTTRIRRYNPDSLQIENTFFLNIEQNQDVRNIAAGRDRLISSVLTTDDDRLVLMTLNGGIVFNIDVSVTPTIWRVRHVAAWGDEYAASFDTWDESANNPSNTEFGDLSFVRFFNRSGGQVEDVPVPGTETPPWPINPNRISGIAFNDKRLWVARGWASQHRDVIELDRENNYAVVRTYSPPSGWVPFHLAIDSSRMP